MSLRFFLSLAVSVTCPFLAFTGEPVSFQGPLNIPNVPRPVTVHSGDFNNDGKIDLCVANGSGSILILFQNPSNRLEWQPFSLKIGTSTFFVRSGDFDNDGFDDLVVADGGLTAFYVKSNGDGTFAPPVAIRTSKGPRWVAMGDWNNDGNLDFATSNLNTSSVSIVVGDGKGNFTQTQTPPSGREHTLEALDYDGDGKLDLALGQGLPGVQLHKGLGDGKFMYKATVPGNGGLIGCVEYIATGDFNKDGKSDMATTCIDDGTAYAGSSNGNGTFKRIWRDPFGTGTESTAIADLDGDENPDLAVVSNGSTLLRVYPGKGDATFEPFVEFGPTGVSPNFLITRDLDGDGRQDVISSDNGSSSITVFYGKDGERFLESSDTVSGFGSAKGFGVEDFDHDGLPDLFFANSTAAKTLIYLKPGGSSPKQPSLTVTTLNKYTALEVADLNGDGIPDLAGANLTGGTAQVALLDSSGMAHDELSLPTGQLPQEVRLGHVDGNETLDMVLPCAGSNQVAVLLALGGGKFADARLVPTIERPKRVVLADIDADGATDFLVLAGKVVAIQYGKGDGDFLEPVILASETVKNYADGAVADLNKDGKPDIILGESRTLSVVIWYGKGNREFDAPVSYKAGVAPASLFLVDVDKDGALDITVASSASQSVVIMLNRGQEGFVAVANYRAGVGVVSHRLMDMNGDGILDLLSLGLSAATIRLGRVPGPPPPPSFKRGDSDGNGRIEINDPVTLLNFLFRGGTTLSCPDAADADDNGILQLTDAVSVLRFLFLEGQPPAQPGPRICGQDPVEDQLPDCKARC